MTGKSQTAPRSSKFGFSVNAEIRKIVEALPIGVNTDTPHLLEALLGVHPNLKPTTDRHLGLKTYIVQALSPLKGKSLELVMKGKGGAPDQWRRIDPSKTGLANTNENITETITAESRNIIPPDIQLSESANKISTKPTPESRFGPFCGIVIRPLSGTTGTVTPTKQEGNQMPAHRMASGMRDIFEVITEKETQIATLQEDIAALKRVADILALQ